MKKRFVVIGAGPCGLYAALTALGHGYEVTVIEREDRPGGLAAGETHGGNHYDLGVHMLHAFDQEVFETCAEAMGEKRIEVPLKAHINWGGKLYQYPLRGRDILAGIPPLRLSRCILGLLLAEVKSRSSSKRGASAEDALIELYGVPLYEVFFEDFTHRYWGIHPRDLSAEFVRRKMPRLSAVDVFKNALQVLKLASPQDRVEGALRFETLHYSSEGCRALPESLAKRIRELGGEIHYDSPLKALHHEKGEVKSVVFGEGKSVAADAVVSTVPLALLSQSFVPALPVEAMESAKALRHKALVVFGFLVRKERCMEALYTYYRERSFHRVGEPKNAGLKVDPGGHTLLIVEKTCEIGDDTWNCEECVISEITKDLEKEGLCVPDEIVNLHVQKAPEAYPVFDLGFEDQLKAVQERLSVFSNLKSTGRQGGFTYPNMHRAMRMGQEAVEELLP